MSSFIVPKGENLLHLGEECDLKSVYNQYCNNTEAKREKKEKRVYFIF